MSTRLTLRCNCGRVRGYVDDVAPGSGCRIVCYCDDCQASARWHGQAGVMNEHGGTDIFQVPPARVHITEGAVAVQCLRLTARPRALYRFHASCCKTPLGNSLPRFPFVGVICSSLDIESTGRTRDEVLGPPLGHIMGRHAVGKKPAHVHRTASPALLVRAAGKYLAWWMRGLGRPSPFFDDKGATRCEQRVLSAEERAALKPAP